MKNELTADQVREVLDYNPDTGVLSWRIRCGMRALPGNPAGWCATRGYIAVKLNGRAHMAHRLIWLIQTGRWPDQQVDHIDGDTSNNRWPNLRLAQCHQNQANARLRRDNKSGVKGVSWNEKRARWRAVVRHQGKQVLDKFFVTKEEAKACAREARLRFHGEFAHHG
jgi:hypothetical protein